MTRQEKLILSLRMVIRLADNKEDAIIFEDKYIQEDSGKTLDDLMTPEEHKRVAFYLQKYEEGKSDMTDRLELWEEIHKAYKGERTDTVSYGEANPVAVNILLSQIEGQVSSMMNNNITGAYRGIGYSDQKFARTAGIVGDFILKQNDAKGLTKIAGRRYIQFGNAIVTPVWDADALNGFGMPKIEVPKLGTIFFDDKIDDIVRNTQECDYIIQEVGSKSIMWARRKFGDDIADAIQLGNNEMGYEYEDEDTDESFTYIRVWTRNNEQENLQLLEISKCGVLLSESDPSSPYYKHTFNRYPIFVAGLYKDESDSYYFGDGQALLPMQKLINKLYDEIILAVKFSSQGRTYADPQAHLNPAEFAEADPSKLLYADNPLQFIKTERGTGLNEVVFNLLSQILDKVQETTRFSSLMTGNDPGRGMTATQAGIQMQQGITGIDDKKSDLSTMLGNALNYCLGLTMEFWTAAKAFRVADNEDDFEWIDTRQFTSIPEMIPASSEFIKNFSKENPKEEEKPKYMQLDVEDDTEVEPVEGEEAAEPKEKKTKGATKQIELDVIVNIGEGLPNNKIALYNMVLSLSQVMLIDEVTGQPRPLIGFKQFKTMVETYLGIRIEDQQDENQAYNQLKQERDMLVEQMGMDPTKPLQGQQQPQPQGPKPMNVNPNIPGANLGGQMKGGALNV